MQNDQNVCSNVQPPNPILQFEETSEVQAVAIRWQDSRPLEFYRFACFLDQIDVTRSVPRNSHTAVVGTISPAQSAFEESS